MAWRPGTPVFQVPSWGGDAAAPYTAPSSNQPPGFGPGLIAAMPGTPFQQPSGLPGTQPFQQPSRLPDNPLYQQSSGLLVSPPPQQPSWLSGNPSLQQPSGPMPPWLKGRLAANGNSPRQSIPAAAETPSWPASGLTPDKKGQSPNPSWVENNRRAPFVSPPRAAPLTSPSNPPGGRGVRINNGGLQAGTSVRLDVASIDAVAARVRLEMIDAGGGSYVRLVQKVLSQLGARSWEELGVRPFDVPTLRKMSALENKVRLRTLLCTQKLLTLDIGMSCRVNRFTVRCFEAVCNRERGKTACTSLPQAYVRAAPKINGCERVFCKKFFPTHNLLVAPDSLLSSFCRRSNLNQRPRTPPLRVDLLTSRLPFAGDSLLPCIVWLSASNQRLGCVPQFHV
jgi:hypothetical protein